MITHLGVGLSGGIIKEVIDGCVGVGGGGSLVASNGVKRYEHCAVDSSDVIEEHAYHMLNGYETFGWYER